MLLLSTELIEEAGTTLEGQAHTPGLRNTLPIDTPNLLKAAILSNQ